MITFNKGIFRFRLLNGLIWACLITFFGYFAIQLPDVLRGNGFEFEGEYKQTNKLLEQQFGQGRTPLIILFENTKGMSEKRWQDSIQSFLESTQNLPFLEEQISPLQQPEMLKKNVAYGIFLFTPTKEEKLKPSLQTLRKTALQYKESKITITGEPIMVEDLNEASQKDLAKAEMIGLPIALLVLIFAFGGLVAASIPIAIGVSSILVSMGVVYFFHHVVDLSIFILNIIPMIGLALSIDFALLFINRFKEEILLHSSEDSLIITLRTAGRSIIFSGLCVFIGLSGLLFIRIDIFQNVAIGGMVVVLVSILSSLTLLPLILFVLGSRINSLPLFRTKGNHERIWINFSKFVMRFPILITLISLAALLTCLIPIKDIQLAIPGKDSIPPNYESRIAFETYKEHFIPNGREEENELIMILEAKEEMTNVTALKNAGTFIEKLEKDDYVTYVESPFSISKIKDPALFSQMWATNREFSGNLSRYIQKDKMLLRVYLADDKTTKQIHRWVNKWDKAGEPFTLHLGGQVKFEQEIFNEIFQKAPYGFLLIIVSTLIILTIAFQSILIPIKAIFMNILSLGATFGIVVWIFQYGHFQIEPVTIGLILPVFVFSLVFGLSMDYEVFLISRIHEVYLETGDNTYATIIGLTSTSKIITSAAAIMIVITGAFSFTGVMPIKQIGIGIAIAIFIDATIVRLLLVPALMKLLGDWNWWFFGRSKVKATK
ncbi:MMPL family transporter [Pseudoneobacillus rhizosphaerae]|uniref:Trehalose monomycolate exporter MmpL3 n=1 Tax=Pseudoneobacillus rhizosphaerae TaxID=2880968 RepID=A0A9C7GCD5_9BACI|nr:MMPL family transporter [Pseudoneobacillus rhizosphaerae]CAG9609806.1 Trehalose monomycolate exporter MmpL3 [Pseudoneobacillus rhizosphaerae]